MSEKVLIKIKGITGHAWKLRLYNGLDDKEGFDAGYYFDNPGNGYLEQHHFSGYKPEDDLKTGRTYVIVTSPETTSKQYEMFTDFYINLNRNTNNFYSIDSSEVEQPKVEDLIIFAVECGVTNPKMLRALSSVASRGPIIDINPSEDCIHVNAIHIQLFIQPDGSVCS
jgi:hypothetical protein